MTCFIAEHGRHFDTQPRCWQNLANRVREVSVPGTHHTVLVAGRQALATAIGEALERVTAGHRRAAST